MNLLWCHFVHSESSIKSPETEPEFPWILSKEVTLFHTWQLHVSVSTISLGSAVYGNKEKNCI
jgi:hypothetical protein